MPDRAEFGVSPERSHAPWNLHALQSRPVRSFGPPPRRAGRGIVTSAYWQILACAWVLLSEPVRLGVDLPVEAWHRPGELSEGGAALLRALPLRLTLREMADDVSGYAVEPAAIWRGAFREVLWIDFG